VTRFHSSTVAPARVAVPRPLRAVSRSPGERKGVMILAVFVGLFLVGLFAVAMLQAILQAHQIQQRDRFELQARFLMEAGIERARAQLARDPGYSGERWLLDESLNQELSPDEIAGEPESQEVRTTEFDIGAEIQIEVLRGPNREIDTETGNESESESESRTRTIRVTVHHPFDSRDRIRVIGEFALTSANQGIPENEQPTTNTQSTDVE
jgi:hypothetical protein